MTLKEILSFTRTRPDGRTGLGFGVILLVMVICMGLGLYVVGVVKWAPKREKGVTVATPNSDSVRRGGTPAVQPLILPHALDLEENDETGNSLDSTYRQVMRTNETKTAKPEGQTTMESASGENNGPPETGKSDGTNGWVPVVHPGDMPAVVHHSGDGVIRAGDGPAPKRGNGGQGTGEASDQEKFYYVTDLLPVTNAPVASITNKSGFLSHHFLPRGYKIPIVLLNRINTSVGALPVELSIAKDVEWNGKMQLPFGWRIFGTSAAGNNHKVHVTANMILDPLGREYPITGMVLNTELEPGFDGYPLPSPLMAQVLPMLKTSIGTFIDAEKDTITQPTLVSGGLTSNLVANTETYSLSAKNALLDGTTQVLQGLMERKIDEMAKLYPEGDVVPRGTLGFILITAPLDLNLGTVGGSEKFLTKDEASPAPHTITIKEQQTYSGTPRQGINQLFPRQANASATPSATANLNPTATKGLE